MDLEKFRQQVVEVMDGPKLPLAVVDVLGESIGLTDEITTLRAANEKLAEEVERLRNLMNAQIALNIVAFDKKNEEIAKQRGEIAELREEDKDLAGQNYEFIGALLKLNADNNCTGNCNRGDGKITGLCWRHKLLQDTLGDELSYADLRASGGLPERAALDGQGGESDG